MDEIAAAEARIDEAREQQYFEELYSLRKEIESTVRKLDTLQKQHVILTGSRHICYD